MSFPVSYTVIKHYRELRRYSGSWSGLPPVIARLYLLFEPCACSRAPPRNPSVSFALAKSLCCCIVNPLRILLLFQVRARTRSLYIYASNGRSFRRHMFNTPLHFTEQTPSEWVEFYHTIVQLEVTQCELQHLETYPSMLSSSTLQLNGSGFNTNGYTLRTPFRYPTTYKRIFIASRLTISLELKIT